MLFTKSYLFLNFGKLDFFSQVSEKRSRNTIRMKHPIYIYHLFTRRDMGYKFLIASYDTNNTRDCHLNCAERKDTFAVINRHFIRHLFPI